MKRVVVPLIVASALAVGASAGFRYASHRAGWAVTDTIAAYELGNAADTFTVLHNLRAGDTNAAFDSLEGDLDLSVLALDGILEEYPAVEHAANYTNLLRRIAAYRAAHPYHDEVTNLDAAVKEILDGVGAAK
jgi:hypothetical protein